ncbi:hypothetical protein BLA50215_04961 [Burkholderia lata]|uniref:hypothetical protein n=1 Tax=Burkholderia lata (strain ATCC 17760 / DSM 23089 / LMG 22485 / NCIMB 9086 / R18194 / 383) TaxID=482957 RepID=UPI001453C936|nr:hypothetical protein [Burkholderia lata]VWD35117.1 hypothetical protein BLA50215_04961 [Burkholderia lata]
MWLALNHHSAQCRFDADDLAKTEVRADMFADGFSAQAVIGSNADQDPLVAALQVSSLPWR